MSKKTDEKKCTKCGILKVSDCFYKCTGGKYTMGSCKECHRKYSNSRCNNETVRQYYHKNKIQIQAARKEKRNTDLNFKIKHIIRNSRQHSKVKSVSFTIDFDYLIKLYEDQNGLCAISNEPLEISGDRYLSNMLSLDRINSSLGYEEGNVQWVCVKYNMMKAHATMEEFINMCRKVVEKANEQKKFT